MIPISDFGRCGHWLVVITSTAFVLHNIFMYQTKITCLDLSKFAILVPLKSQFWPSCEMEKYEIPSILYVLSPGYLSTVN
jgi:hypothetical protein